LAKIDQNGHFWPKFFPNDLKSRFFCSNCRFYGQFSCTVFVHGFFKIGEIRPVLPKSRFWSLFQQNSYSFRNRRCRCLKNSGWRPLKK
jgi:hypothetical protein